MDGWPGGAVAVAVAALAGVLKRPFCYGKTRIMNIYVASSWRNEIQPHVVSALKRQGYEVYDFRNPKPGNHGFHWSDLDPDWERWTPEKYRSCLGDQVALDGFRLDMDALRWCDAVIAVQPFGVNASLELGWAAGVGKRTILMLAKGEPELMVKMCDYICIGTDEVLAVLEREADIAG